MTLFNYKGTKMNTKPQDKLFAILSVDRDGNEGICMLNMPGIGPVLGVIGDENNLATLKNVARKGIDEAWSEGLKIVIGEFMRTDTREL